MTEGLIRAFNSWGPGMSNIFQNEFSYSKDQELRNADDLGLYKYR